MIRFGAIAMTHVIQDSSNRALCGRTLSDADLYTTYDAGRRVWDHSPQPRCEMCEERYMELPQ